MDDLISRREAIDEIEYIATGKSVCISVDECYGMKKMQQLAVLAIANMSPAQPKIIRCKDCKYSDENWRRVSVRWLPCMDMRTGSNWYCGSAERREE